MAERSNITNLLLLSVLTGILLVSGSLQCAFDCLTRVDTPQLTIAQHSLDNRVDSCHPAIDHVAPAVSCPNKACHQRLPLHHNLGGPEIYRLEKLAQPLYSSSRQPQPQYRSGSAIVYSTYNLRPELHLQATSADNTPQILYSIRTTVIIC